MTKPSGCHLLCGNVRLLIVAEQIGRALAPEFANFAGLAVAAIVFRINDANFDIHDRQAAATQLFDSPARGEYIRPRLGESVAFDDLASEDAVDFLH